MSILIKGMEMPKSCGNCYMFSFLSDSCRITNHVTEEMNDKMFDRRFDDCPLISVPEPHGDLIDKNELTMCSYDLDNYFWFQAVPEETLNEARVIIPASEEE